MKKTILLLAAICFLASACNREKAPAYTLTGQVKGVTGTVYLEIYPDNNAVRIDSTQAVDGKFAFKGSIDLPVMASVMTADGQRVAKFFLENSPIKISGEPGEVKVTGSGTDDLYQTYVNKIDSLEALGNDPACSPGRLDSLQKEADAVADKFIAHNNTSVAAAYVLYRFRSYSMNAQDLGDALANFDPAIAESGYLKASAAMVEKLTKTAIGKPFTDIMEPDAAAVPVSLSSVTGKGYTLVLFWASWCHWCVDEIPTLVDVYGKVAASGFNVYAVSLDSKKEAWTGAIAKYNMGAWTNVCALGKGTDAAADAYAVRGIPANILISPDGKIVERNIAKQNLESVISGYVLGKK